MRTQMMYVSTCGHNNNVMWAELGHSHFLVLGESSVGGVSVCYIFITL